MDESAYPHGLTTTVLSINDNQSLDVKFTGKPISPSSAKLSDLPL